MAGVKREVTLAREEIADVKITASESMDLLLKVDARISQLFWTGAGVALAVTVIVGAVALGINIINSGIFK